MTLTEQQAREIMLGDEKKRTKAQNRAMHLLFTLIADEWNGAGYDMRAVLKPTIPISWTTHNVKEYVWKSYQKALLGKESTTELTTKEIDQIYNELTLRLGEKGIPMPPFPSQLWQSIINESQNGKE